jgi:hypothetical protein
MNLPAFLRAVINSTETVEAASPTITIGTTPARLERRRPVYRCTGCHAWRPPVLVFMSNGGNYCPPCARAVHAWSGVRPAGRRFDDIRTFDDLEARTQANPPDSLTG